MRTIEDIIYDNVIYLVASVLALLLYEMRGTHIAIPLPNAHLMSFIYPFKNTVECKNHIKINNQKMITLFAYEDNMQWLITNSYFKNTPQIQKIYIFCSSVEEKEYWTTFTERYRDKIEKPFLYDELDVELLLFGFRHTKTVRQEFGDDGGMLERVTEDNRKIMNALATHFWNKANSEGKQTRQSEEAQA